MDEKRSGVERRGLMPKVISGSEKTLSAGFILLFSLGAMLNEGVVRKVK